MVSDFSGKKILIVGLGLMGGSIAKALKDKAKATVFAVDKNPEVLAMAEKDGVIAKGYEDASEILPDADFVVVCLYPQLAVEFINSNMGSFKSGAVITDICGVKTPVTDNVRITRDDIEFVPAHPMAGSERQGYECSFATLFEGCNYIITPLEESSQQSVEMVSDFAKTLGAKNIVMSTPEIHDEYIAYTSQIPHVLAVAYMHESKGRDITSYAGGSFRDVSRVASINEVMWAQLFCQNKEKLAGEIKNLRKSLADILKYVEECDLEALQSYMKKGAQIKENYDAANKS